MSFVLAFGATVLMASPSAPIASVPTAVTADTTSSEYFTLARRQFRRGDAADGLASYLRAADLATTPQDWELFGRDLAWVATPQELAAWRMAGPSARLAMLKAFWSSRDARDGLPPGGRLAEHVRRLDLAMARYRIHPKRGKAPMMRTSNGAVADVSGGVVGVASPLRDYAPSQGELDDRGVIFVRQGEPASITYSGGLSLESWTYEIDDHAVTVHFTDGLFDGASGNGMLVASPPIQALAGVCQVDQAYCSAAVSNYRFPEQRERLRQVALAAIRTLTTTDAVHPDDEHDAGH